MIKTFVLDTNVMLHDPDSIFQFEDNKLVIPICVVEELDEFKKGGSELNRNAREVLRSLDKLRLSGNIWEGVPIGESGGLILVDPKFHLLPDDFDLDNSSKVDNKILSCALAHKAILVSKDTNLRIKANAVDLKAEDYTTDKADNVACGIVIAEISDPDLAETAVNLLYAGGVPSNLGMHVNTFCQFGDNEWVIGRCMGEIVLPVTPEAIYGIKPRNPEQACAFALLLDPDVKLVTLIGKAGTGKTLLALAAALQLTVKDEKYNKILVSRPVVPMGNDIGFLPGDINEKLRPYMQPIYDNLDFIGNCNKKSMSAANLEEAGYISIEPLTYIRGRSIPDQIMIIDEAQNLSPKEVKTILTRAGENTKVILTGDPDQIDNPYVDRVTNGLTYIAEKFRGRAIAGSIILTKGERSALSELASILL
jgi:PhoH-like ATPase